MSSFPTFHKKTVNQHSVVENNSCKCDGSLTIDGSIILFTKILFPAKSFKFRKAPIRSHRWKTKGKVWIILIYGC